jgi:hypothetical protein
VKSTAVSKEQVRRSSHHNQTHCGTQQFGLENKRPTGREKYLGRWKRKSDL